MDEKKFEILLIEDDPGDVDLTEEALRQCSLPVKLNVVNDGVKAISYLRQQDSYTVVSRPDLILLDLNLPLKDGRDVLKEIKADDRLRSIPVVIFTTSRHETDIIRCYHSGANCYITKPFGLDRLVAVMRSMLDFWFTTVRLPPQNQ